MDKEAQSQVSTSKDLVGVVLHFSTRYDELRTLLEKNHGETQRRLDTLMDTVQTLQADERAFHTTPCRYLLDAVPNEDIAGHKNAHQAMLDASKEMQELFRHTKRAVVTTMITVGGGWMLLQLWQAFLQGPRL